MSVLKRSLTSISNVIHVNNTATSKILSKPTIFNTLPI